jgi:hypothetical protein
MLLMAGMDQLAPVPLGLVLGVAMLAGAFPLMRRVKTYYRQLGHVEQPAIKYRTNPWPPMVATAAWFVWFFWMKSHPPHDPRCLYAGGGVLLIWLWFDMGRSEALLYYPALGFLVLAVGAPSRTFGYLLPAMGSAGPCYVFVGLVLLLVALLDHRQLVAALARFPRPVEEPEEAALAEKTR